MKSADILLGDVIAAAVVRREPRNVRSRLAPLQAAAVQSSRNVA
jgi:hypothetical protein